MLHRMDDDANAPDAGLHEAEVESRWEAAPAVALIVALHLALAAVSHAEDGSCGASRGGSGSCWRSLSCCS